MSRTEDFRTGSLEHVDPTTLHPHMNDYPNEVGNTGGTESSVGYVRTEHLAHMHGNGTDRAGIDRWKERLQSGDGFTDPIMVEFDPTKRIARVGEGNHRVEAAKELGISHVPVRVVRSRFDADYTAKQGGHAGHVDPPEAPWKNGRGDEYWPPTMHPKYVFPKATM